MKIGVSSYSFSKYMATTNCSYFDLCDKAKEIGFDGVISLETSPSVNLPQSIFEEMSVTLSKILKSIVE